MLERSERSGRGRIGEVVATKMIGETAVAEMELSIRFGCLPPLVLALHPLGYKADEHRGPYFVDIRNDYF